MDYVALNTELTTDPNGYGYAPLIAAGSDADIADLLNLVRAEITLTRANVTPLEVLEAIKVTDFINSPNPLYASWFESLTQFPNVRILKADGSDTRVLTNLMSLLVNGSASETRLRALASRSGSRAEQLFGAGERVTAEDVAVALRG